MSGWPPAAVSEGYGLLYVLCHICHTLPKRFEYPRASPMAQTTCMWATGVLHIPADDPGERD